MSTLIERGETIEALKASLEEKRSRPAPRESEAKPVGAAASGRVSRSARRFARKPLLLLVVLVEVGAGVGEDEAGESPHLTPAWEAPMLAARRRSTRGGAGDAITDGMVAMSVCSEDRAKWRVWWSVGILLGSSMGVTLGRVVELHLASD